MNISSGPLFGPLQPQPDFSALSGKYSAPSQDVDSGMQAISYGGSGGPGFSRLEGAGGNELHARLVKTPMHNLAQLTVPLWQMTLPL